MRFKKQFFFSSAVLFVMSVVWATPSSGVLSKLVLSRVQAPAALHSDATGETVNGDKWHLQIKAEGAPSDFQIQDSVYAPGGYSGWHSHPGPVLVSIKEGTATWYDADCVPHTYAAGTGFIEDAGVIHNVRNESTTDNLHFLTTYIVPTGVVTRIDEAAPAIPTCNVP